MNYPQPGDYIDIHNHGSKPGEGVFSVENIMTHEERIPSTLNGLACSMGIHPWYLSEENINIYLSKIRKYVGEENLIAIGETGFDRLRGPSMELQRLAFEAQVKISSEHSKPLIIHCVRAWDELLASHKKLRPKVPWMIHGFRGRKELALQLISRGMYISFWIEFILKPESARLLKELPADRIFLETDGADKNIQGVYRKVASDLGMSEDMLRLVIHNNFRVFFNLK
jgi:TatD DNase family protein